jgi:riboflavin kinase/FMN adenylyltransferase
VATLGVFDGVHLGHAEVIGRVVSAGAEKSLAAVVVTFDRHPASVTSEEKLPAITSLEHRLRIFAGMGVDSCVVLRFAAETSQMTAAEFVRRVFHELLGARLLVLGFDCRFGRDREGDVDLCRAMGEELGFDVETVPPVSVDGSVVSSTAIRGMIEGGQLAEAERLLGRRVSLYGTVVHSYGLGVVLGYPTANIDPHNEAIPPDGVYATWCSIEGRALPGVTSIGRRETLHPDGADRAVETHIIGESADLYGRDIEVEFVRYLRNQRRFPSRAELKQQIARDVAEAAAALKS